jgi:hypothetical protein
MRGVLVGAVGLVVGLGLAGCGVGAIEDDGGGGAGGGGGGGGGDGDAAVDASDLAFCVEETNRYRATIGLSPLRRSDALEAYAADGARIDHESGEPHKHFLDTGGGGIAFAENEIPRWPLAGFGTVRAIITQGLADMWAEGPGGGHHDNMATSQPALGCGVYQADGLVTVVQDFGP